MNLVIRLRNLAWLVAALLAAGCASVPEQAPKIERISAEELERLMPKPTPNLSLEDIVQFSKSAVTADEIIQKIKDSQSQYVLSASQALALARQGVDAKVLDYIQAAHEQAIRDSFAEEINKREKLKQLEQEKLKRDFRLNQPYYDPFWGYPRGPWGYPRPYFGPSFQYQFYR